MEWIAGDWFAHEEYRLMEEVRNVLESLDEIQRAVLEARFYERLSYRAIAARFTGSVHPGSGEWAVKAALLAFRREWDRRSYDV